MRKLKACFVNAGVLFALVFLFGNTALAQITSLQGRVTDPTGGVLPGSEVTIVNLATGVQRTTLTDEMGRYLFPQLSPGRYDIRAELVGFKTYTNQGLEFGAGQTVRQTFVLEVGQLSENITVSESTPLVATASATQQESLGTLEVSQLPLARRNLVGLMTLSPGVTENSTGIAGGGNIRLNGVAEGGTAITVDGTDAVSNSETRGTGTYGGQNQISVMSIEAVAEVLAYLIRIKQLVLT